MTNYVECCLCGLTSDSDARVPTVSNPGELVLLGEIGKGAELAHRECHEQGARSSIADYMGAEA